MDIFFQDPSDIPLPPDEVRIKELRAESWPDNRRVRVYLEITPFQIRPSGEIILSDAQNNEVSSISIIETIDPKMEFTLHIRGGETSGEYTLNAILFYLEELDEPDEPGGSPPVQPKREIIDQAKVKFVIGDT
ncbi:MAG: hypothetical protein PVF74_08265 [Anaerolineales bacterium]|jgi:hypothetical protein